MGLSETVAFIRMVDGISRAVDRFPNMVATEAVQFSKERFRQQNWIDNTTQPWKKRKAETWGRKARKGRGILVDTGRLFRSIRKIMVSPTVVVIGTDVPYGKIHNEGGRLTIHQRVKPYTRSRTERNEVSRPGARTAKYVNEKVGDVHVRGFTRTIHMNMPHRQFLGSSAVLNHRLERILTAEIVKAARKAG